MTQYPKDTVDQYIESNGGYCPECTSESVIYTSRVSGPEGGITKRNGFCNACSAHWAEQYILDTIEAESHGIHHNHGDTSATST